jgi:hypothetical protein
MGPGEVKVDLADFDLKKQENFLNIFFQISVPAKTSSKSFCTSDMTSKYEILMYFLTYFCQKSCCGATLPTPPPFRSVLLLQYYRPTGLWFAVRCGASHYIDQFPFLESAEGGGLAVKPGLSLFLSRLLAPH